ncbi:hypothetical protein EDEG_03655 [Edhazardia aedis USNM 41457]|uniref:Metallo-beta-lactamase domain-containing protein n=1 Tax=Edhazardia aedis (strain USNM 41457) TaxID=1003232 RepID=J9D1Z3_EDHAE|nr:hypothetical protein EDEG_03655 [Edhazardia aedis USNM 41457]|eukprot:EJW01881.1 hypothetical protein EDEG_03655 [Edhazardia aedis USNM 41457]
MDSYLGSQRKLMRITSIKIHSKDRSKNYLTRMGENQHCSEIVSFIHIFHNLKYAIVFDPFEPHIVKNAMDRRLDKELYDQSEIDNLSYISKPRQILFSFTTHGHHGHSSGNEWMKNICENVLIGESKYNNEIVEKPFHTGKFTEGLFTHNDLKKISIQIKILYTPCHTLDSYCFFVSTDIKRYLVTGDTFSFLGISRFFNTNSQAMVDNIHKICENVNDYATLLYGHDYKYSNIAFVESIADKIPSEIRSKTFLKLIEEKKYNPFFNLKKVNLDCSDDMKMSTLRCWRNDFGW